MRREGMMEKARKREREGERCREEDKKSEEGGNNEEENERVWSMNYC